MSRVLLRLIDLWHIYAHAESDISEEMRSKALLLLELIFVKEANFGLDGFSIDLIWKF